MIDPERTEDPAAPARRPLYVCGCGHELRVIGRERHSVFFDPGNDRLDDPVMDGLCPQCSRALPGKS